MFFDLMGINELVYGMAAAGFFAAVNNDANNVAFAKLEVSAAFVRV